MKLLFFASISLFFSLSSNSWEFISLGNVLLLFFFNNVNISSTVPDKINDKIIDNTVLVHLL
jgi:hypothetical protein